VTSGPGSQLDPYRCDACRRRKNRCVDCRAKRAAARRDLLDRKRAAGICLECTDRAIKGQVRCVAHAAANNARSSAAHKRRRAS
jgi:hypothetical protein